MGLAEQFTKEVVRQRRDSALKAWATGLGSLAVGLFSVLAFTASAEPEPLIIVVGAAFIVFGFLWVRALARPLPPEVHETTVFVDDPESWASCSCGWVGDTRPTQAQASHDADLHAPGVTPALDVWEWDASELGHVLVSPDVVLRGRPILVMYAEHPQEPGDSGWRVYSGEERPNDTLDPSDLVRWSATKLVDFDHSVETALRTKGPCAFARERPGQELRRTRVHYKGLKHDPKEEAGWTPDAT